LNQGAIDEAARLLANSERAVALTGAGVSVESGVPDFRSPGGLWERFDPMVYASIDTFRRQPERSWELFVAVEQVLAPAEPNPAHVGLAQLEEAGVLRSVITQNIDGLHQRAGSRNVREFHGSHSRFHCIECGNEYSREAVPEMGMPPRCSCGSVIKPAVVLFGEGIPEDVLQLSFQEAGEADAMLVVGTSAMVYPAASLPRLLLERGRPVIEVDLATTSLTGEPNCHLLQGRAGEIVPRLVERVLRLRGPVARAGRGGNNSTALRS